jgi:hypothetical protein
MNFYADFQVKQSFPNLNPGNSSITSPFDVNYNCIAWAASDTTEWWDPQRYWPPNVRRVQTLDAYIEAYGTLGFVICDTGEYEEDFEKVVIYTAILTGQPTHAARQLSNGKWTSKLGKSHDISHDTPEVLSGPLYGTPTQFMKRAVT